MKLYRCDSYMEDQGMHHPVVPVGSIIAWDEISIAVFPVRRADGGCAQVVCFKQTDGSYLGDTKDESYTFTDFPSAKIQVSRAHELPDTDTGTFTATEIHNPQPPNE